MSWINFFPPTVSLKSCFRIIRTYVYLHAFRGVSKQASERDGVCDSTQIDEQDGRQRLDVERVDKVAGEEWQFPLDVEDETPTKP